MSGVMVGSQATVNAGRLAESTRYRGGNSSHLNRHQQIERVPGREMDGLADQNMEGRALPQNRPHFGVLVEVEGRIVINIVSSACAIRKRRAIHFLAAHDMGQRRLPEIWVAGPIAREQQEQEEAADCHAHMQVTSRACKQSIFPTWPVLADWPATVIFAVKPLVAYGFASRVGGHVAGNLAAKSGLPSTHRADSVPVGCDVHYVRREFY